MATRQRLSQSMNKGDLIPASTREISCRFAPGRDKFYLKLQRPAFKSREYQIHRHVYKRWYLLLTVISDGISTLDAFVDHMVKFIPSYRFCFHYHYYRSCDNLFYCTVFLGRGRETRLYECHSSLPVCLPLPQNMVWRSSHAAPNAVNLKTRLD